MYLVKDRGHLHGVRSQVRRWLIPRQNLDQHVSVLEALRSLEPVGKWVSKELQTLCSSVGFSTNSFRLLANLLVSRIFPSV